jgi:4-hydroxy 2-oxovalerate aldolase
LLEEFESMKQKYHWGDNILYYLSAINNIHPSYVQELLNQDQYTTYQILDAINFLKDAKYTNFTRENLNQAIFSYRKNAEGTFNPEKLIKNKSVLILANGASLQEYKNDILNFIESKSPFVLSLNINKTIDERFIDAYIACYPSKIILDINQLKKLKRPLIIPKFSLPIEVNNQLKNRILNYGLSIKKNIFKVQKKNCTLPTPLVMGYALAFCKSGLANQVYLAGFDGYESNDPRNIEADVFLKFFTSLKLKLKVITPSRYDLPKQSLYSLSID